MPSIIAPSRSVGNDAKRMALNLVTLAFTGTCADFEKPFLEHYAQISLRQIRFALFLGIFFYAIFGLLDYVVVPELKYWFWLVRYCVVCPIALLVILLSFTPRFPSIMQPAIALVVLIGGGGIIYMTIIGPPLVYRTYYAGLMLVLMLNYTFLRARFLWSSLAGCTIVIFYLAASFRCPDVPQTIIFNNNFFCVTANFLGMLVSYSLEFYARRDYYMSQLLEMERQRAETANQQLEQTVEKRTAMLALANEELRHKINAHQQLNQEKKKLEDQLRQAQKMEAVGTLAGGIAHDFNNILAAIMGHAELALMQLDRPEKAEEYLSEVLNASDRAKDLVSQILSFSRQSDSELKPLQISTIVKEALRLIRSTLPTTIAINKKIEDQHSIVVGNATQVHQIMMNLCTNAAHAMDGAGGTLTVELKPHDIEISDLNKSQLFPTNPGPGQYIRLTITDTGHGIPAHLRDRIFDPYFTTKEKGVGTGLGLAVAHGIIQKHGGTIDVESSPGQGTSFIIYLPRIESQIKPEIKTLQAIPNGNESILFVDDDPALAELGSKLLTTLGYKVVTQTDPRKALKAFLDQPQSFDLIITDMIMPGLTGKKLAHEILKNRPNMPVIVCTGFSDLVGVDQLTEAGIKGVLYKPITIYHLAQVIRQTLEGRPIIDGQS